jgi:hypothetical protein
MFDSANPKRNKDQRKLKTTQINQEKKSKKITRIDKYFLIITLNENGLNSPIEDMNWFIELKNRMQLFAAYKKLTQRQTQRLTVKGWKTMYQSSRS